MRFLLTLILFVSSLFVHAQQIPFSQLLKMVGQKAVISSDYLQENSWEFKGVDTSWQDPFTASATIKWQSQYKRLEATKNINSDLVWDVCISLTSAEYTALFKKLPAMGFYKVETEVGNKQGDLTRTFRKGSTDVYLTTQPDNGASY